MDNNKERAINNAIASIEMEGFVITDEQRELVKKVVNKEIPYEEALETIKNKYKQQKWLFLKAKGVDFDSFSYLEDLAP